ncbi:hypothetical protein PLICRDRAFT_28797 [Plicaturopsis crispa FD-325 SS-3]|nr:hypothetical protein PLICRDRAFT_28797 [Plicaturopsis crispa FD-325 SS-3]
MDYGQPIARAPPGKQPSGINCLEYRGLGPPTSLTGGDGLKLGDIYLDMSGDLPGGLYKVYANLHGGWEEWEGDTATERKAPQLWHPRPSKPKASRPLHEVFYFAFGPYIQPAWVSLTVYRASVKQNLTRVDELIKTSSAVPDSRAYPRSAHQCVSALLSKERSRRTIPKRKRSEENIVLPTKRMHIEPNKETDTLKALADSESLMATVTPSPYLPFSYTPPGTPSCHTGVSVTPLTSDLAAFPDQWTQPETGVVQVAAILEPQPLEMEAQQPILLEKGTEAVESFQTRYVEQGAQTDYDSWRTRAWRPASPSSSLSSLTDDEETDADIYVASYTGKCWPEDAKLLTWSNGQRTIGPWQCPPGEKNFDLEIAELLSRSPDGSVPETNRSGPGYVVLDFESKPAPADQRRRPVPDSLNGTLQSHLTLERDVRIALSQNKPVVVRNIPGDGGVWFTEGHVGMVAALDQTLQWQDSLRRATWLAEAKKRDAKTSATSRRLKRKQKERNSDDGETIYEWTTIREFLAKSEDPNVCGNLLDLPQMRASYFPLVLSLSDDGKAWDSTKDDGLTDIPERSRPEDKDSGGLSMRRKKWRSAGPVAITLDQTKLGQWLLLSHAGFLTFVHHDAAGLGTWVAPQGGSVKVWAIVVPKVTAMHDTRAKIFERFGETLEEPAEWAKMSTGHSLSPGKCLTATTFMPPGAFHLVLTVTPSVTLGGHFYTYESMHLTEMARAFDHSASQSSTNTEHPAAERAIARMALALPTYARGERRNPAMLRRPFAGLARMILHHTDYKTEAEQRSPLRLADFDLLVNETANDLKFASWIVKRVMDANNISEIDLDNITRCGGPDYDQPGTETVSLDCLQEIDDIKGMPSSPS